MRGWTRGIKRPGGERQRMKDREEKKIKRVPHLKPLYTSVSHGFHEWKPLLRLVYMFILAQSMVHRIRLVMLCFRYIY